jgi:hypothetical protein
MSNIHLESEEKYLKKNMFKTESHPILMTNH